MERKAREEKAHLKKKILTFKSTPTNSDEEDDDQEDDEYLSLLMKKMRRIYDKTKFNNRRRWQGKEKRKIVCYNCKKPETSLLIAQRPRANLLSLRSPIKRIESS